MSRRLYEFILIFSFILVGTHALAESTELKKANENKEKAATEAKKVQADHKKLLGKITLNSVKSKFNDLNETIKNFINDTNVANDISTSFIGGNAKSLLKKGNVGSCLSSRSLSKFNKVGQRASVYKMSYAIDMIENSYLPDLTTVTEAQKSELEACLKLLEQHEERVAQAEQNSSASIPSRPTIACDVGNEREVTKEDIKVNLQVLSGFVDTMKVSLESYRYLNETHIGDSGKQSALLDKIKNASCDGTQSGLATKAVNAIKKNKYVIGGAAGLAYLAVRDERKQDNKIKREEEEKLNAEIEACSDVNKVGGAQCAQLFADKCLTDSSEKGCAEYTSALCEQPGSSGNPVGVDRPYCVLKNSQTFCSGDSAASNATSPACQWVNNLPEECTENPAAPQCFVRFENQHVFAAVCNQNNTDPLCSHVVAPTPGQKLIVFGPATNFNGGANLGVVVSNQGRAPSSGVFGDITQTSSVATAPAADVASADTSLFSSSSVSEACLNEQLTNCGI